MALPRFTVPLIVRWADAFYERNGRWPTRKDGRILEAPDESWHIVDQALTHGQRGLPGGSTLVQVLAKSRGRRNEHGLPDLTVEQILDWVNEHHRRTGKWPTQRAGRIPNSSGETWLGIDAALRRGTRGLSAQSSLAQLLARHRHVRNKAKAPRLTHAQIVRWAQEWRRLRGRWPGVKDGRLPFAPGETWVAIDLALARGTRGLAGGSSLRRVMQALPPGLTGKAW
jgi:hypothetical protein